MLAGHPWETDLKCVRTVAVSRFALWIPRTFPCSQPETLQMLLDSANHQVTFFCFFHFFPSAWSCYRRWLRCSTNCFFGTEGTSWVDFLSMCLCLPANAHLPQRVSAWILCTNRCANWCKLLKQLSPIALKKNRSTICRTLQIWHHQLFRDVSSELIFKILQVSQQASPNLIRCWSWL